MQYKKKKKIKEKEKITIYNEYSIRAGNETKQ